MMSRALRRWSVFLALALGLLYGFYSLSSVPGVQEYTKSVAEDYGYGYNPKEHVPPRDSFRKWRNVPLQNPLTDYVRIPEGAPGNVPRIQHDFSKYRESPMHAEEREKRRLAVREAFQHSWKGYKDHAWLHDEVMPLSGQTKDPFGAWGATLVDSLDTLWIMGLEDEFDAGVNALKLIDFTTSKMDNLNVFETVIRYIGGMLGAYDISGGKHKPLLHKAIELGEMVYHAFDTPNHMPISRWFWKAAEANQPQSAPNQMLLAELGSLTLEFTRLTQLTGDPKYYDAVHRIAKLLAKEQNETNIPGLWPISVNASSENLHQGTSFTFGGMADSVYEYLPKQYLLLNGRDEMYKDMYIAASTAMKKYLVYEPLIPLQRNKKKPQHLIDAEKSAEKTAEKAEFKGTPGPGEKTLPKEAYDRRDLNRREYEFSPDYANPLLLGTAKGFLNGDVKLEYESQHLSCFAGGMTALGVRAFAPFISIANIEEDVDVAERLTAGCVWSYRNTATGIGPEIYHTSPCRVGRAAVRSGQGNETDWTGATPSDCRWDRDRWLGAVRDYYISHMDAQTNALAESEDPDRWEHFVLDRNIEEGFVEVNDARYLLRPEAIESVFVLWRVTGDPKFQDQAWEMFQAIDHYTRTKIGYASMADVTRVPKASPDRRSLSNTLASFSGAAKTEINPEYLDSMESFWTAETLKYFYLMFVEPDVMSLDEFVLNTEAHPFRWRQEAPAPRRHKDLYSHYNNE